MMTIEVKVNGKLISHAYLQNMSEGAEFSDYYLQSRSNPSPVTGAGEIMMAGHVRHHNRMQTAWALVAEAARIIAEHENCSTLMK